MAPPHTHTDGLRVLRTAHVAPVPPAGGPALPEHALPLTFLDAIWLCAHPVERVFFYRLCGAPFAGDADAVLSTLVDSLSRVLHVFHPLAGRLRLTPGKTNRELAKIAPLVPNLPEGGALLAVQATVLLPARRGLALGVTVHHAACDGSSSTHFLHTWAAACAGDRLLPEPPVIDRTLIRDRRNMYDAFASQSRTNEADHVQFADVGKLLATFTLSPEHLHSIKDAVAGKAARRGVPPPRCTFLVATIGLTWLCFRLAGLDSQPEPHGDGCTHLLFPVDHRSRLEPRVPEKYLGNCIGPGFAAAPKKELATTTIADGLFTACAMVAAAVDEAVRGEPGYWERWVERIIEACADDTPFSVAGSTRFRVYDVDFGFGRPAKVDIVSVAKTGAMSVAEDRSGSGGIEIGIALPPERMERFRRWLADAIATLVEN
ncbi:hypothetical protein E2562_034891 [Oryza meyeriana var. granulata]|uniref:Uncharacterized protein n=1 Tax=Oryza meyeriana var. granulata TaxID=110450 RepID=A0A6G1C1P2_9ORYZ|nr:hypothetical protein E2562_034891 [Oryza meyeriana var. granulata]